MNIIDTTLPDVKILKPQVFKDGRGFFMETFRDGWFKENIADRTFVQENHSKSCKGVPNRKHTRQTRTRSCRRSVRRGRRYARRFADFRQMGRRNPVSAKPIPALDTRRLRTRFLRFERHSRTYLQMHGLLQARSRTGFNMERPGNRHRLAASNRAAAFAQRPCRQDVGASRKAPPYAFPIKNAV